MHSRISHVAAAVLMALAAIAHKPALADTIKGPASSATPYSVNVPNNVDTFALLTVGDSVNRKPASTAPYRMVGIADGLGAYDNHDGTFTVLMNHEIGAANGITRAHGFAGVFVSQWIVRKADLAVLRGGDLVSTAPRTAAARRSHARACIGSRSATSINPNWGASSIN